MSSQLELKPFEAAPTDPNVRELERILDERRIWTRAAVFEGLTGWDDRTVRELASASDSIISGQKGYCHIDHAKTDEINHCCNALESQGSKMLARAQRLRRRAHQLVG